MVINCVAYGCSSVQKSGDKSISFHRFPHTRPDILSAWVLALGKENWQPSKYSRLCSMHFIESCYKIRPGAEVKQLREDAIPSLFNFRCNLISKRSARRALIITQMDKNYSEVNQPEVVTVTPEIVALTPEIVALTPKIVARTPEIVTRIPEIVTLTPEIVTVTPDIVEPSTLSGEPQTTTKAALRRKIRILQAKLRRRNHRIVSLKDLIKDLKRKSHCTDNLKEILNENFSGFPLEVVMHQLHNKSSATSHRRYSSLMKEFAVTLYFHSPKAYKYVRGLCHLPHPSQIRKWISSV